MYLFVGKNGQIGKFGQELPIGGLSPAVKHEKTQLKLGQIRSNLGQVSSVEHDFGTNKGFLLSAQCRHPGQTDLRTQKQSRHLVQH
jgi:hypothetical protein